MTIQQLPAAARTSSPWRNGGGVTREVAADPAGAWRVSLALVAADGAFSLFPEFDRVLTVVDGPGLELTVGDAEPVALAPLRPFAFPGAVPTTARLPGGPVTALNLMTRHPGATVTLTPGGGELRPAPGATVLALTLAGQDAVLVEHPATAPGPSGPGVLITLSGA